MIHDYDTHFWLAKTPVGWISAEDHASYEPIFAQANRIRIEPLSLLQSIQAVLDADVPHGYAAFLRTDLHRNLQGDLIKLGYILAVEKGEWPEAGRMPIGGFLLDAQAQAGAWDGLAIIDGFRAELCCWNGQVAFESSPNFSFDCSIENGVDIYKFVRK